mgnify:CR=1 FL=1
MKFRKFQKYARLLLFVLLLVLGGCTISHKIQSSEASLKLQTGSPLRTIDQMLFAFKDFNDSRGLKDPRVLAESAILGVRHSYRLNKLPAKLVKEALMWEFKRNGHVVTENVQDSNHDYLIEGVVYKALLRQESSGFWGTRITAEVAVKLTISKKTPLERIFTKNYQGEYFRSGALIGYKTWAKIFDQALLKAVQEMSTDQDLMAFFEGASFTTKEIQRDLF